MQMARWDPACWYQVTFGAGMCNGHFQARGPIASMAWQLVRRIRQAGT